MLYGLLVIVVVEFRCSCCGFIVVVKMDVYSG